VSGWDRNIDDLAGATAELVMTGWSRTQPLVDPHAALAARDAVLVELRALVGSVAAAAQFAPVRELTMYDVVHRPAPALHQTLSELPRALAFGAAELASVDDKKLLDYEQAWQRAAAAATGLEVYLDGLGRLPAFWWRAGQRQLVLPAFSAFTGRIAQRPAAGDALFACAGHRVLPAVRY